jgi:hypothetical protein
VERQAIAQRRLAAFGPFGVGPRQRRLGIARTSPPWASIAGTSPSK